MAESFSVTVENGGTWEFDENVRGVVLSFLDALRVAGGGRYIPSYEGASHDPTVPIITSYGPSRIAVIKEIRAFYGLGLKEAKEITDNPTPTRTGVLPYYRALEFKKAVEAHGATVQLPNALDRLAKL